MLNVNGQMTLSITGQQYFRINLYDKIRNKSFKWTSRIELV